MTAPPPAARLRYSPEPPGALGTAGGIAQALPLLGFAPFVVVNGDIWCDYDYSQAAEIAGQLASRGKLAHLVLVANPPHHAEGDFALNFGEVASAGARKLTFAGIGIYQRSLFAGLQAGTPAELAPMLRSAMDAGQVAGEYHYGRWTDVGTPERLAALDADLSRELGT